MVQYIPFKETLFSPYIGCYQSFGIIALQIIDLEWEQVNFISDVSPCLSFVTALAQRCTRCQLDPIHLFEVVLDAI